MRLRYILSLFVVFALIASSCEAPNNTTTPPAEEQPDTPNEPNEPEGITFEAQYSSGAYYGDHYGVGLDLYFISLSDNGFDERGYVRPNSTYYRLDLCAPKYEGDYREYMSLPEGEYHLSMEADYGAWTLSADGSEYVVTGESEVVKQVKFEAAVLVVTAASTTLTAVIEGEQHVVTFAGEHIIANMLPRPMESKEWSVEHAYALYYGDKFNIGVADNFYLYLSDKGLDELGFEYPEGTYYGFDLYIGMVDSAAPLQLPHGAYVWDDKDTLAVGTISAYYTKYYVINSDATGYADARYPDWASVTVDEEGVVAEVHFGEAVHKIVYQGVVDVYDLSTEEN